MDNTYLQLIHKEVDGIIEPNEQAKLYEYLNENPEAQILLQDLKQTANLLDSVEAVEPPQHLRHQIIQQVRVINKYKSGKTTTVVSWITGFFAVPGPKLAYAFALGIVAGIFIYALLFTGIANKNPLNNGDLTGTIGLDNSEALVELKNIPVDLTDINGNIRVKTLNDKILIDLNLNPIRNANILINYEPSDLDFFDLKPTEVSKSSIEIDNGTINMTFYQKSSYLLVFQKLARKTIPIKLSILSDEQIQLIQNITIPRSDLF